jgi:hypothetical protein
MAYWNSRGGFMTEIVDHLYLLYESGWDVTIVHFPLAGWDQDDFRKEVCNDKRDLPRGPIPAVFVNTHSKCFIVAGPTAEDGGNWRKLVVAGSPNLSTGGLSGMYESSLAVWDDVGLFERYRDYILFICGHWDRNPKHLGEEENPVTCGPLWIHPPEYAWCGAYRDFPFGTPYIDRELEPLLKPAPP